MVNLRQYSESEISRMTVAMRLSLGAGFFMLLTKLYAYYITGSAAILSDAAESIVHVLAVSFAAYSFRLSLKPADQDHLYGHDRISFFSAGFEGAMIALAAVYIIYEATRRWLAGLALQNIDAGAGFIALATLINGALGWYLVRTGKKYHSIVLEANGKHVLTDCWTSLGVVVGLGLTMWSGWLPFDPIIAIIVALNILWSGWSLMRRSVGGLMDEADPRTDSMLREILEMETSSYKIQFHNLRHRNTGNKLYVEFHLLFPKDTPIADAHEQATRIEREIQKAFPFTVEVISHLEPIEGHDEIHQKLLE
jgi:cation diffusion facilitator family transporter